MTGNLHLVTGGAGSGKSAYAEQLVTRIREERNRKGLSTSLIYLATMHRDNSAEFQKRLRRHLALRAGKGFATWEAENNLVRILSGIRQDQIILLEDLPNLLANEMYGPSALIPFDHEDAAALEETIARPILVAAEKSAALVAVTGEIFADDLPSDPSTRLYMDNLAHLHTILAAHARTFTEVVCGIPLCLR